MKYLLKITSFLFLISLLPSSTKAQVLDDITERSIVSERRLLDYAPLREADIFWEKRIWRVIDAREKMNLAFMYPEAPFFEILTTAAEQGALKLYTSEDDKFTYELDNVNEILSSADTTAIYDPDTGEITYVAYTDDIDYQTIKRFRIKEVWYFDENTSQMKVRILGIAPMQDVMDDNGNFMYEKPLFWVHYPSAREALSRHKVFNTGNDSSAMTWADLFEMRQFSSYIYKESNIRDNRLQDVYSGIDILLEGQKIKEEIFTFEHDLWSY